MASPMLGWDAWRTFDEALPQMVALPEDAAPREDKDGKADSDSRSRLTCLDRFPLAFAGRLGEERTEVGAEVSAVADDETEAERS